ncbi:MAG: hypothetical protein B9S37_00245 [Verrucomicrobiia bacterium Tous-C3TDCM]|nr:MAG: hypothetical protein B9S37_00245 [Verrucomicrobiae bacterium Tous-C3TDCM]PAZ07381.1 MAG: hypothetical protein CAK88_01375 [Verrucomicrobiae bacterium AMD-G2]
MNPTFVNFLGDNPGARGRFPRDFTQARGFTLIVTISLLVLLTLIVVGLLSLSAVSLRASSHGASISIARANARLSVMMALGELQNTMGSDRNITAPASILDKNPETVQADGVKHPRYSGVWQARAETIDAMPDYSREPFFREWLVSHRDQSALQKLDFAENGTLPDPVTIYEIKTSANDTEQVQAGKVPTDNGALAWYVIDENCKASINRRDERERAGDENIADLLAGYATPGTQGITALDEFEEFPANTTTSDKFYSINSLSLAEKGEKYFQSHAHLTPYAESVLANVTTGSLRKDLSLYLERTDLSWQAGWGLAGGQSGLPRSPLGPNKLISLSAPNQYDVLSWKNLYHWSQMHRQQLRSGALQFAAMDNQAAVHQLTNPSWNSSVTRIAPVMMRMQMVLSYSMRRTDASAPPDANGESEYELLMHAYPVVTLWNPFNVSMFVREWSCFLHTLPLEHTIFKNDAKVTMTEEGSKNGTFNWGWPRGNMTMRVGGSTGPSVTLAPGESKLLTYKTAQAGGFNAHDMTEQFNAWLPSAAGEPRIAGKIRAKSSDSISVRTEMSRWETSGTSYSGADFQTTFDFRCEPRAVHAGHDQNFLKFMFCGQVGWRHEAGNPSPITVSERNYPKKTVAALLNTASPFINLDVRYKTLDEQQLPNKSWLHNIPMHPYAAATSTSKHASKGVDAKTPFFSHPYAINFEQINGIAGVVQNRPFIGLSNRPGGEPRIAAVSVPLAPLTSLAQLQNLPLLPIEALNWSGHYLQNQAIGNSYAMPGLAPTAIKQTSFPFYLGQYFAWQGGDIAGNTYQAKNAFNNADYTISAAPASLVDRSYVANHLLFDEYFFSSMSAQTGPIFKKYGKERTLKVVVEDFYNNNRRLPIAAYRPYLSGKEVTPERLVPLLTSRAGSTATAHLIAASRMMVEGGFNINSTSEPAWRAMLAAAHLKRPVTMNGNTLKAEKASKFLVNRHSAPLAGAAGNGSGTAEESNRWLGYRELTEEEMEQLAEAIVRQVKLRGPFRSLGEFVNRRRSSDTEMARYGALQAALEDPKVDINKNYRGSGNEISSANIAGTNYKFPAAALGSKFQGTPAYISQADILTPMAPIIQARSDTFVIRGYGEAKAKNGAIIARASCEAVVQRVPDFVDSLDAADVAENLLKSPINRVFGRRFVVKSFRWLADSSEI